MGWVVNATPRPLYPRGRNLVPNLQKAGWAPGGGVLTTAENLAPPTSPRYYYAITKLIYMYVHTCEDFFSTPVCFFHPERYCCHMSFCIHYHLCTEKYIQTHLNPLKPELNPICYLLALLGAHHFLHVSRIRVKLLTLR
jgi:hypothetical protein